MNGNETSSLQVHLFKKNQYYAFDTRNYSIIKLTPLSYNIFKKLLNNKSLPDIINSLKKKYPLKRIIAIYFQISSLMENEFFSTRNITPVFNNSFNRIIILTASGCNMGCHYCFENKIPIRVRPKFMTKGIASEAIKWFFKYQTGEKAYIQLYGGEPFLNWELIEYIFSESDQIALLKGVKLVKYIITNGTLIDEEKAKWLSDNNVKVQVSIDGDETTHDRFRKFKNGDPTFKIIKDKLQHFIHNNVDFNIRAVLTRQNLNVESIMEELKSLGSDKVSFDIVSTDNEAARLTNPDWDQLVKNHSHYLNKTYQNWDSFPDEVRKTIKRICNHELLLYGCGRGISEFTIDPDGNIYDCERICSEPLATLSENKNPKTLPVPFIEPVDQKEICSECWARYLCGGGCRQLHLSYDKDARPRKEFCKMRKDIIETSIFFIDKLKNQLV